MPPRRRVPVAAGRAALASWACDPAAADRPTTAWPSVHPEELGIRAPGRSVEVRVPPFGVVQCVEGRSTGVAPAEVIETDAATWLARAWQEGPRRGG